MSCTVLIAAPWSLAVRCWPARRNAGSITAASVGRVDRRGQRGGAGRHGVVVSVGCLEEGGRGCPRPIPPGRVDTGRPVGSNTAAGRASGATLVLRLQPWTDLPTAVRGIAANCDVGRPQRGTFGPDAASPPGSCLRAMVWFFRVVALADGDWECRRGPHSFDSHRSLAAAVEHCTTIAAAHLPAEILVHALDGSVRSAAVLG
jgi:hypothetical protein